MALLHYHDQTNIAVAPDQAFQENNAFFQGLDNSEALDVAFDVYQ